MWGGGFYPADWFYDLCDEMGLVVWQDMMFACANYRLTDDFVTSIHREITQNVRRIRHHASLGIWCGNNEMEQFALVREFEGDDITAADYLIQNEFIIPEILKKEDPDTFYWPSSPSSGGRFDGPQDPDRGDVHFSGTCGTPASRLPNTANIISDICRNSAFSLSPAWKLCGVSQKKRIAIFFLT